jgi:hypothetical protein
VFGSATAEISATVRFEQPVSFWKLGFVVYLLQPAPPSLQALSAHPRVDVEVVSVVPPTPST